MTHSIPSSKNNDYAIASDFNVKVKAVLNVINIANAVGVPDEYEIDPINKAYVLIVNELQVIYDRNPELWEIEPSPIWSQFNVLESHIWKIIEYFEDSEDYDIDGHIAKVNRLCIIYGASTPKYSPLQLELLSNLENSIKEYAEIIVDAKKKQEAKRANDWQISQYTLNYDVEKGHIIINDVYKVNKRSTKDESNVDLLLKQVTANPNVTFTPALKQTSKNISSILSGIGLGSELRRLFFPRTRANNVHFRPVVSRVNADLEGIDTSELDRTLKSLGAKTESLS